MDRMNSCLLLKDVVSLTGLRLLSVRVLELGRLVGRRMMGGAQRETGEEQAAHICASIMIPTKTQLITVSTSPYLVSSYPFSAG
jgi:hypothetical protein